MKRALLAALLIAGALNATDFTTMSTEQLISMRGTVASDEREAFKEELQSRLQSMTAEERASLGVEPKGYGDMSGSAPQDGTGLGNKGESSGGGFGGGAGGFGGGSGGGFGGGGHGGGHGRR